MTSFLPLLWTCKIFSLSPGVLTFSFLSLRWELGPGGHRHHRLPKAAPQKGPSNSVLPQTRHLRWVIRKHQTHPNWRTFYKINGPYSLRKVNVLTDKERLRKCAKWKRKKEIWCRNAILEGTRASKEHGCSGTTGTSGKTETGCGLPKILSINVKS